MKNSATCKLSHPVSDNSPLSPPSPTPSSEPQLSDPNQGSEVLPSQMGVNQQTPIAEQESVTVQQQPTQLPPMRLPRCLEEWKKADEHLSRVVVPAVIQAATAEEKNTLLYCMFMRKFLSDIARAAMSDMQSSNLRITPV